MLDTDIVSYVMQKRNVVALSKLREAYVAGQQLKISSIVHTELLYGIESAASQKRRESISCDLAEFLDIVEITPWPNEAASQFAVLRARLERKGQGIGLIDGLIAAHALAIDATLVTNNESDFSRVPGLKIENWTK